MTCSMTSISVIWRSDWIRLSLLPLHFTLKVSDSIAKKMAQSEYVSKKPSKTFALIKSEMEEKAKRKNKSQSRVRSL